MDQEGDPQHRRFRQVLQRPHHLPVRPWDLGCRAHSGEACCAWWPEINLHLPISNQEQPEWLSNTRCFLFKNPAMPVLLCLAMATWTQSVNFHDLHRLKMLLENALNPIFRIRSQKVLDVIFGFWHSMQCFFPFLKSMEA